MNNIEELKKAAMKATQGEWWQDVVETEGTYGVGDDCSEGFHSYAVYGPDNNSLLDMTNSTAAIIHTEEDGDYLMAWDETGRRNAEYIALANPAAILDLIAQLEAIQKERGVYAAIYEDVGAIITLLQGNEWDEHVAKTNMGGALEHQITRLINSIADINTKLLAAEAALSAANEKLSKPVYQYRIRNLYNGQASGWQTIAPDQVNTVLRMNPENAEFQILAAGFTVAVEGNADAE
ncbi:Uncharacterised protein [Yersinia frederiksenii]|nr:Uncharacterised protein [Yersinia frederiksenii]